MPPYFALPALADGAQVAVAAGSSRRRRVVPGELDASGGGHLVGGGGVANYRGPVDLVPAGARPPWTISTTPSSCSGSAKTTCERIGAPGFAVEAAGELAAVRCRRHEPDAGRALLLRARPGRRAAGHDAVGGPDRRRCSAAAPAR